MKITLTQRAIGMLNSFLRQPGAVPLDYLGIKQYTTPTGDETAKKQVIRLQEWFEKCVCQPGPVDADGNKTYKFPETWSGGVKSTYLDRLKEIVKHYERVGSLVAFTRHYIELDCGLDGKLFEADNLEDDVSDNSDDKIVDINSEKVAVKEA